MYYNVQTFEFESPLKGKKLPIHAISVNGKPLIFLHDLLTFFDKQTQGATLFKRYLSPNNRERLNVRMKDVAGQSSGWRLLVSKDGTHELLTKAPHIAGAAADGLLETLDTLLWPAMSDKAQSNEAVSVETVSESDPLYTTDDEVKKLGDKNTSHYEQNKIVIRLLRLAADTIKEQNKKIDEQAVELKKQEPKVNFANAVTQSGKSLLYGEMIKMLRKSGAEIGTVQLSAWLREHGYLRDKGAKYGLPTDKALQEGILTCKESPRTNPDGSLTIYYTVKITGKGQQLLINTFTRQGEKNGQPN